MLLKKYFIKTYILYLVCFLFIIACKKKEKNSDFVSFSEINLIEATHRPVYMSEIFENIEYIKLETTEKCLFDIYGCTVYLTDKYVITTWSKTKSAYMFDRHTGKFIKQVGSRGRGPNEYTTLVNSGAFDYKEEILYFDRHTEWIGFQIETDEVSFIKKPQMFSKEMSGSSISSVSNFFRIDSSTYVSYVNNWTGNDSIKLVFFNKEGNILRTEANRQTFVKVNNKLQVSPGKFYRLNNDIYFKELFYNDTIFRITPESLSVHLTFFSGNKQFKYHFRESEKINNQDYYFIRLNAEEETFAFFNYSYEREFHYGFFNKNTGKTVICENKDGTSYYINDVDNIGHFVPGTVNNVGEFYHLLSPEEIINSIRDNNLKSPKVQPLLDVKEEDNPIIVVATIKK